ncbi:TetR/AcrR family transcriptional regulator [Pseudonocardia dioxanivorans]|uniref:TetR/AcrR family transcriptional regulator n=1 Tax=Pseudonocardia dioxanivorans TaxID=240495 RepID=UPI000CD24292|nr:TetR/AcrR family transcriptional regulator [Pseudonocardia dioxanivorans]
MATVESLSEIAGVHLVPELTPAGRRLLDAASELFYEHGIRAVGVDLIAERAGTTKKTLYDRFGSKDELVALYLRRRAHRVRAHVAARVEGVPPGRERLLAVYDALESWLRAQSRGCGFVNAYAEVGGTDHPAIAVIRAEKAWTRELFADLARDAGLAEPDQVAAELHLLYEGATVVATAGGDPSILTAARKAAARVVAAAA